MSLAEEIVGITAAKNELPRRVTRLESRELERVVIMRQNSPVAVIVTIDEYDRMRELAAEKEFLEDALAILQSRQHDDGSRWTLEEIKSEFGIE